MKIQLDTDNKTIKLENEVLLSKLVETLNKLLPNGEWKKFTLQTNTTITHWHEPIVMREYPRERYYPWWGADHTLMAGSKTEQYTVNKQDTILSLKSGVYDIEA